MACVGDLLVARDLLPLALRRLNDSNHPSNKSLAVRPSTIRRHELVRFSLEHDPARAVSVGNDPLTDFQARSSKGLYWDRDLVLHADAGGTSTTVRYSWHDSRQ